MQPQKQSLKDWFTRIRTSFNSFADVPFSTYRKNTLTPLLKSKAITPSADKVFRALELVPFDKVKVVILGQDPYYQVSRQGQYATGLAFELNQNILKSNKLQSLRGGKSLRTILQAVAKESGQVLPVSNSFALNAWASQGVLLLNTALTTKPKEAGAHVKLWKNFMAALILALNKRKESLNYLLTCKSAKSFLPLISAHHQVFFNYKHPSRCWRISRSQGKWTPDVEFFKLTGKTLQINWAQVLN